MKITAEMLSLIRSCRDISQTEFSFYMSVPQARLSDLETAKIPITKHYEDKIWNALESLQISSEELQHIYELVQIKTNKQNTKVEL
ncbi:hypothetical protein [Bacillus thuringiensis]|uniref:hypothetical protein n=1 Tax=Bacillus thuringiensis TaxID=1428 RepID=UPI00211D1D72|nr:hypothetical protein [Bacillus thuringiensis]